MKRQDAELARQVCLQDEEIDALYWQIFRELLVFMMEDPRTISRALPLLFVARHLERIGDRATNVAETVIYTVTGQRTTAKELTREEVEVADDSAE